jgi:hypothetical protein
MIGEGSDIVFFERLQGHFLLLLDCYLSLLLSPLSSGKTARGDAAWKPANIKLNPGSYEGTLGSAIAM